MPPLEDPQPPVSAGEGFGSPGAEKKSDPLSLQKITILNGKTMGKPWEYGDLYGKSPFFMSKSTISMAIFNSYVCLPVGSDLPI